MLRQNLSTATTKIVSHKYQNSVAADTCMINMVEFCGVQDPLV